MHSHSLKVAGFGSVRVIGNSDWSGTIRVRWIPSGTSEEAEIAMPGSILLALTAMIVRDKIQNRVEEFLDSSLFRKFFR